MEFSLRVLRPTPGGYSTDEKFIGIMNDTFLHFHCYRLRSFCFAVLPRTVTSAIIYATADEAVAYYVLQIFFCFFSVHQNYETRGTAERIFLKLLPNDTGKHGV